MDEGAAVAESKDLWDKAEITGKVVGAVAIPLAAVVIGWHWNAERSERQTAASMTEIAVGILSAEPDPDTAQLRVWAISVLQQPQNPPLLTNEAASILIERSLADKRLRLKLEEIMIEEQLMRRQEEAQASGIPNEDFYEEQHDMTMEPIRTLR
jgi:hypothetical protein